MRKFSRAALAAIVGERVRRFREERNWDIRELATVLEIPVRWLEEYEAGLRLPRTYTLYRLADVFQVSFSSLLGEEPPERPLVDDRLLAELRRIQKLDVDDRRVLTELLGTFTTGLEKFREMQRKARNEL
jgi:transcriptional regulator with XRE-family HTH domain